MWLIYKCRSRKEKENLKLYTHKLLPSILNLFFSISKTISRQINQTEFWSKIEEINTLQKKRSCHQQAEKLRPKKGRKKKTEMLLKSRQQSLFITWVRPGLSDVRATPQFLVSALSSDDFPTFDLPKKWKRMVSLIISFKKIITEKLNSNFLIPIVWSDLHIAN